MLVVVLALHPAGSDPSNQRTRAAAPPPARPNPGLKCVRAINTQESRVNDIAFSPDSKLLLSSSPETVAMWDIRSGKRLHQAKWPAWVHFANFVSGGKEVVCATGASGGDIHILNARSFKARKSICQPPDSLNTYPVVVSPGGDLLAAATEGVVTVREIRTGKIRWRRDLKPIVKGTNIKSTTALAFAPDGKTLAVALDDEAPMRICDAISGKELRRLPKGNDWFQGVWCSLVYAPNGDFLAAGSRMESLVRLWSPATGASADKLTWKARQRPGHWGPTQTPPGPSHGVHSLAVSPDGKTLAVACHDGKLRLFEVATAGVRHEAHIDATKIVFSLDGKLLASGDTEHGIIQLWRWRDPVLVRRARLRPAEIERVWVGLSAQDPAAGYQAVAALTAVPDQAVECFASHLRKVGPFTPAQLKKLVSELDADDFDVRESASRELGLLAKQAEGPLRAALAGRPSLEMRRRIKDLLRGLSKTNGDQLRFLRSVEVLESVGTPAAHRVLSILATGHQGNPLTEDACLALKRLQSRHPSRP
jgi:WD40 repeat protein